jgi:DNA replication licensing factor MCM7
MDVDDDDEPGVEELSMNEIRARVLAKSFTETQFMETIIEVCRSFKLRLHELTSRQYEDLNVWTRVANNTKLRFV